MDSHTSFVIMMLLALTGVVSAEAVRSHLYNPGWWKSKAKKDGFILALFVFFLWVLCSLAYIKWG